MTKNSTTRNGRILNLASELRMDPRTKRSKVKTRHYDNGQAIQLNYRGAPPNAGHTSYGSAFAIDTQEVRSFEHDDRFFVESFGSEETTGEISQENTLNQEIPGAQVSSFAFGQPESSTPEIEQHNNLNQEITPAPAASMAFNADSSGEEIIQQNTLNEENNNVAKSASFNNAYNAQQPIATETSPVLEERQLWREPAPTEEQQQDNYATQSSFEDDIKAILAGQKLYDSKSKSLTGSSEREEEPQERSTLKSPNTGHAHDIFASMAKSMSQANAYDFGTLSLEKSFDEFERMMEKSNPVEKKFALASEAHVRENKVRALNDLDYAEDFSSMAFDKPAESEAALAPLTEEQIRAKQNASIQQTPTAGAPVATPIAGGTPSEQTTTSLYETTPVAMPPAVTTTPAASQPVSTQSSYVSYAFDERTGPEWPARPTAVRILSLAEKQRIFGRFEYEATTGDDIRILGSWVADNIVDVRIPQLDGKIFGGRAIPAGQGSIRFHRLGQNKLVQLWAAWERAGLLDRILTFHGGFVPRFVRNTATRSPRPLSNHAWGTAFDINARQNPLGSEPALLNQPGCVRELVEIANQHGFFWGGHYQRRRDGSIGKDGMHFEIAHPFNP